MSDDEVLKRLAHGMLATIHDIQKHLKGPAAPDAEVKAWPLYAGEDSTGGIWCGDEDCPLQAENSEIGDFREGTFTLTELHEAIENHILARRDREADEDSVSEEGEGNA